MYFLLVCAGLRRTGRTETAGGSAGFGRFGARQARRISGSAEAKRSPAAGSGAGGPGESEAVWSPAQRVSTRRSSLDRCWLLPPLLARCVMRSGTQILVLKGSDGSGAASAVGLEVKKERETGIVRIFMRAEQ